MKSLHSICESLLDADFDVDDNTILYNQLGKWMETAALTPFKKAAPELVNIMSGVKKVPSTKCRSYADDHTIVILQDDRGKSRIGQCRFCVIRQESLHIKLINYPWTGVAKLHAVAKEEVRNASDWPVSMPAPGLKCWILPPEAYDELRDHVVSYKVTLGR